MMWWSFRWRKWVNLLTSL